MSHARKQSNAPQWLLLLTIAGAIGALVAACSGAGQGPRMPPGRAGVTPPPRPTPVQMSSSNYRDAKFQVQARPAVVYSISNVVSGQGVRGLKALSMAIFIPQGHDARDKPGVVIPDAGGADSNALAQALAARGYIACVAQVRLPSDNPPDPAHAAIVDAHAALRWIHAHATEFGIEPTRIALAGLGDGGKVAIDTAQADPELYVSDAPQDYDRHPLHPFNTPDVSAWARAVVGQGQGTAAADADPPLLIVGAGSPVEPIIDFLTKKLIDEHVFYYEMKLQQDPHGQARRSPGGGYYKQGEKVTLNATPDPGYRFVEWQGDIKAYQPQSDATVTGYSTVSPRFAQVDPQKMNKIDAKTQGQGTVALDPPGGTYIRNSYVRLYKLPSPGWRHSILAPAITRQFDYMDLLVDRDSTISVIFQKIDNPGTFKLETSVNGTGTIALDPPGGSYMEGTVVRATAQPASGSSFVWWAGDTRQTGPTITVVMSTDKKLTAGFAAGR